MYYSLDYMLLILMQGGRDIAAIMTRLQRCVEQTQTYLV